MGLFRNDPPNRPPLTRRYRDMASSPGLRLPLETRRVAVVVSSILAATVTSTRSDVIMTHQPTDRKSDVTPLRRRSSQDFSTVVYRLKCSQNVASPRWDVHTWPWCNAVPVGPFSRIRILVALEKLDSSYCYSLSFRYVESSALRSTYELNMHQTKCHVLLDAMKACLAVREFVDRCRRCLMGSCVAALLGTCTIVEPATHR